MILGAVDWTDDMHTGGSFIFTSLLSQLLFFLARGRRRYLAMAYGQASIGWSRMWLGREKNKKSE